MVSSPASLGPDLKLPLKLQLELELPVVTSRCGSLCLWGNALSLPRFTLLTLVVKYHIGEKAFVFIFSSIQFSQGWET